MASLLFHTNFFSKEARVSPDKMRILLVGLILLLGTAAADDIPYVFNGGTSNASDYDRDQLINISTSSPDLAGVPAISSLNDSDILEFPADRDVTGSKSYKTVGEIKEDINCKVWLKNGQVLFSQGRYEEARLAFNQSIQSNPNCAECWCGMADMLLYMGSYEEANRCFDVAVALAPQFSNAWLGKAEALYFLGRCDEAVLACDAAILSDRTSASAWFMRALILERQSREAMIRARELM